MLASRIILQSKLPNLKFTFHTLLDVIKSKDSERLNAQLLKDLLDVSNTTEETLVKKLWPSESSDQPSKSLNC